MRVWSEETLAVLLPVTPTPDRLALDQSDRLACFLQQACRSRPNNPSPDNRHVNADAPLQRAISRPLRSRNPHRLTALHTMPSAHRPRRAAYLGYVQREPLVLAETRGQEDRDQACASSRGREVLGCFHAEL